VAALSKALKHWDRGFESRSSHVCMAAYLCVMLSYIGTGQRVLSVCLQQFIVRERTNVIIGKEDKMFVNQISYSVRDYTMSTDPL